MYKVILLPEAKKNISVSAKWYNKIQSELGKRFAKEVKTRIKFIKDNPLTVPISYDNTRTAIINVFPFMIHYTIIEQTKQLIIIGVYHTSRDPITWKDR